MRWAVAAALASGVLLWLASPAGGLGWLAWLAPAPAAAVALADPRGRAGRLAPPLAYAVALELLLVPALPFGLTNGQYGDLPPPLIIGGSPMLFVALVLVPAGALLLWGARFGQPWLAGSTRWAPLMLVALPAAGWAALDFLRVKADPGAFWGPLSLTQHDLPTASLATLAGPAGASFAIALVGYALAFALVRRTRGGALGAATVVAAVAAAALAGDAARGDGGPTVTVAAVQPGHDTAEDDHPPFRRFEPGSYALAATDVIAYLTPPTEQAAARGAELVAWPEAIAYVDPTQVEPARSQLTRLARRTGTTIVAPFFIRERRQGAAVVVSPDGEISEPLPKQRPKWYWDEDGGNRVDPRPVHVGGIGIGTLLGVDNQDPSVARRLAEAGADVLVSSTHDWRALATPQRAFARIAAAATGLPLVRADWRYGSGIVDHDGTDVAMPGTERAPRVVVGDVRAGSGSTPYVAAGDAFGWLCLAIAIPLWLAVPLVAIRRRARRPPAPPEQPPTPPASPPRRRSDPIGGGPRSGR